jgi:hypothetical protein
MRSPIARLLPLSATTRIIFGQGFGHVGRGTRLTVANVGGR